MAKLLKPMLLIAAVFGLVWLAVVIYWQQIERSPGLTDILLWMIALPVSLLALYWIFSSGSRAAKARAEAGPAAAGAPAVAVAKPGSDAALKGLSYSVIASAQHSALGPTAEAAASALSEAASLPAPDASLTDDEGLPVFTARAEGLDEEAIEQAREQVLALPPPEAWSNDDWPDERLRALALALGVLRKLCARAFEHPDLLALQDAPDPMASQRAEAPPALPMLRVVAMLAEHWPASQRQGFAKLLEAQLRRDADSAGWPAERLSFSSPALPSSSEALLHIDRSLLLLSREQAIDLCLFLAAESFIGEASIADWQARGLLRSAAVPNGSVPGEAAAGLLLASAASAQRYAPEADVRMHRVAVASREKPVTASGRTNAETLKLVSAEALRAAALEASAIAQVHTDIELRPAYSVEQGLFVTEQFPALDAGADLLHAGAGTGSAGIAGTLAMLAAAHVTVEKSGNPVACIAGSDPLARAALIIRIAPPLAVPA